MSQVENMQLDSGEYWGHACNLFLRKVSQLEDWKPTTASIRSAFTVSEEWNKDCSYQQRP